jgi:hypothetical protein
LKFQTHQVGAGGIDWLLPTTAGDTDWLNPFFAIHFCLGICYLLKRRYLSLPFFAPKLTLNPQVSNGNGRGLVNSRQLIADRDSIYLKLSETKIL